jgi:Tfp pilus assembly PilM family ATPase
MRAISHPVLGVAFDERSAVVAEVRPARGEWRVERVAEFPFPEGASWQDPESLGKAFGQFLRERHFGAKRAVLGLPANWLMAREVNVPPATAATLTDIVRLQAEREFPPDMV